MSFGLIAFDPCRVRMDHLISNETSTWKQLKSQENSHVDTLYVKLMWSVIDYFYPYSTLYEKYPEYILKIYKSSLEVFKNFLWRFVLYLKIVKEILQN